jgi:hypothetical protein
VGTPLSYIISDAYREMNVVAIGVAPTINQQNEALVVFNRLVRSMFGFELGETLQDWMAPVPQRTAPVGANFPQLPYPLGTDSNILPAPTAINANSNIYLYPPKNSRIVWGGTTMTVYFPEQPDNGTRMGYAQGSGAGDSGVDGSIITLDANGRYFNTPGEANPTTNKQFVFNAESPINFEYEWMYIAEQGMWQSLRDFIITDDLPFPDTFDDLWVTGLAIRLSGRYNKQVSDSTLSTYKMLLPKLKANYRQIVPTVYGSWEIPGSYQSYVQGRWFNP